MLFTFAAGKLDRYVLLNIDIVSFRFPSSSFLVAGGSCTYHFCGDPSWKPLETTAFKKLPSTWPPKRPKNSKTTSSALVDLVDWMTMEIMEIMEHTTENPKHQTPNTAPQQQTFSS